MQVHSYAAPFTSDSNLSNFAEPKPNPHSMKLHHPILRISSTLHEML
jgi:hypothetical protein